MIRLVYFNRQFDIIISLETVTGWHSMKIADDVPYETYFVRRDRSASALAEPLRLRENFVESWLWNEITLG